LSQSCQKVVKKLPKKVQNVVTHVVKKLPKVAQSHHPDGDPDVKPQPRKLENLNGIVTKKKSPSPNDRTNTQTQNSKKEETNKKENDGRRVMKKLGIRRPYATSSHLVKKNNKLLKNCQKVVKKLSKSCQRDVKKCQKMSKNVKKLSNCQKIVQKLSKFSLHLVKTKKGNGAIVEKVRWCNSKKSE
jgi:hypothetical protein